jgi:ABC-2 type transport system permease protein
MASNWTVIARREFLERVRTRWFIIITLLGPIGMAGLIVVPAWLGARSANEKVTIQVVDKTGRGLYPLILSAAQSKEANFDLLSVGSPEVDERLLQERIRDEKINGYLVLPKGLLDGETAIYRGDNATNFRVKMLLTAAIHDAAVAVRAREAGIKLETIASLWTPPITVDAVHDTGHGQATSAEATFLVGYAVMFILYMSILLYAVNVMRSVVQEKTSRVVEIVISATRPGALMLGKVIGVGCVGLLQLGIWALIALLLFAFRGEVLGLFGVSGTDIDLPPLDAIDVLIILTYFALGYFFYAALYAAIGAMVNSDQEAQQASTPVVLFLILPVVCVQLVANDPRSGVAQILTQLPFSSPVLMPMRYLLDGATPLEVALSLAILLASMLGVVAVAGRIYRVGILMYGKRPGLRELARWIRH